MASATACIKAIRVCVLTAAQSGMSVADATRHLEIDPACLQDPSARVPHTLVLRAWEELPKLTQDAAFGLRAAETIAAAPLDIVDYITAQAPSIREAIMRLVRYQRLLHEDTEVRLETNHGDVRMVQRLRSVPRTPRHLAEFIVAQFVLRARALTGLSFIPRRVYFQHGPPDDIEPHRRIFGAPLTFLHAENGFDFKPEFLDAPVRGGDPTLGKLLETQAASLLARLPSHENTATRVKAHLLRTIPDQLPTIENTAKALGASARTLQRSLQAEGTTYQIALDEVRRDVALMHLREPRRTISEIAFLLGFVEVGAFTRAFRRWTGETPSTYRQREVR